MRARRCRWMDEARLSSPLSASSGDRSTWRGKTPKRGKSYQSSTLRPRIERSLVIALACHCTPLRPPDTQQTKPMAEDRKARLAALAARAGRTNKPDGEPTTEAATTDADADRPAVRFRNYAPKDASLESSAMMEVDAGDNSAKMDVGGDSGAPMTKRQRTENATASVGGGKKGDKPISALEEAMLQAKAEASALTGGGDGMGGGGAGAPGGALASLAPQKVNADLKRDIKGKLDRLERRTQRALVELLKERLEKEAEEEDDGLD